MNYSEATIHSLENIFSPRKECVLHLSDSSKIFSCHEGQYKCSDVAHYVATPIYENLDAVRSDCKWELIRSWNVSLSDIDAINDKLSDGISSLR